MVHGPGGVGDVALTGGVFEKHELPRLETFLATIGSGDLDDSTHTHHEVRRGAMCQSSLVPALSWANITPFTSPMRFTARVASMPCPPATGARGSVSLEKWDTPWASVYRRIKDTAGVEPVSPRVTSQ